ncbi:phage protein [Photobacterium aphoticum]|uniref:Phage protein n=1 Tax=Photobacterium aphoticum TaxID=754436 RepID=A0A090QYI3_9GAMM|nr:phage protein [Photobacterium aphoticum]
MAKTMYYGVVDKRHLVDIAKAVCEVLGNGNGYAVPMLVETCAAETLLATFKDPTRYGAGTSCMQVDEGTFDWLKDKFKGRMDNDLLKKASTLTWPKWNTANLN